MTVDGQDSSTNASPFCIQPSDPKAGQDGLYGLDVPSNFPIPIISLGNDISGHMLTNPSRLHPIV